MVSIILPWVRKDGYHRCLSAIFDSVGNGTAFEVVSEKDVGIGCNPMVNKLVRKAKFDIVCFMHDDSEPQPGFLEAALKVMKSFPEGVGCVGFNDLMYDDSGPCTHWMIHKKMLKYFPDGVFYSEEYIHTRVDLELKEVCKAVGRYKWAKNAKVIHRNPIWDKKIYRDATARRCYDHKNLAKDRKTYIRRRNEQGGQWAEARNPREIPVDKIFAGREDYIIIKMSDTFPFFDMGADIDILCEKRLAFVKHIKSLVMGYKIDCREKGLHFYVDLFKGKRLVLRFDLIRSLKEYGLKAKDAFRDKKARFEGGKLYWVPADETELVIRMWEYKNNPKKVWHKEYIDKYAPGLLSDLEPRTKV